ncbi:DNA-binding MurR/RpiR family transcriptional regulator [Anaerosolibacter carboniphilus]|uniref:DNA-binding MurR/RpiR family transcriptional regulator n=1 Tax=Anaerosolibacter carboniphilus TaxID=1417629 RepID=A0A841L2H7_9FIRM|nr:MurR/RpiR family transcriptional regulator [Anaerosolibacter carboniphilus]MBB6217362.1 DNA-binding MurR/RpiR family transcriptional regulator [Anaerosolibacter carboniphilus]
MSTILKIKERKEEYTQSEVKLANYILEHTHDIYNLSVQSLADLSQTSPASVVRFCQKIGYEGFQEFKIALVKDISQSQNNDEIIYEDITIHDSVREIMQKISQENTIAIENTLKLMDETEIERAIEAIANGRDIYIYGVGASGLVAMDFQYKLMRIKKKVSMYLDSHTQLASSVHIGKEDVAIGISYSGKTLETYKAMEMARKKGAITIAITKYGKNPLSEIADINIQVAGMENNIRVGAIASRIAQLTAIDVLFVGVAKKDFALVSEYIQNTRKIVEDLKLK